MSESLALARSDLCVFGSVMLPHFEAPAHVRAVADALEALERADIDRLMIFAPPRHGKSELASVLFPSWALGRDATRSVIAASYSAELATDFGRRCRNIVGSPAFAAIFGPGASLSEDSGAMHRFATRAGGAYYALGTGGSAIGRGADILLLDDPIRSREEALSETSRESLWSWWRYVASTRLNRGGRVVLIATRWHSADLPGRILAEEGGARWTVLKLPAFASGEGDPLGRLEGGALWPERFDGAALAATRGSIGGAAFESLYQQNPVAAEGLIFKAAWLQGRFDPASPPEISRTIQSWDCSFGKSGSSDYSACVTIGQGKSGYFVLHVFKARLDFPALKKKMRALAGEWNPSAVLVEDTASGQSAIQELRAETTLPLIPVKATKEKLVRWEAVSPLFEAGRVFFPNGAAWLEETIGELASAPAASHDDVTDALAQALSYLRGHAGGYFDIFDPALHVIPRAETNIQSWHTRWISMAWGYEGAAAISWHAVNERREITTYRELITRHKTAPELARMIVEASLMRTEQGELVPETLDRFIVSESAFAQKFSMRTIADELGAALRKAGLPWPEKADDGPGSRISGFALLLQLLEAGTGFWRISDSCVELISSLPLLLRDDRSNVEDIAPNPRDRAAESCRIGLAAYVRDPREPKEAIIRSAMTADDINDRIFQRLRAEAKLSNPLVIRRRSVRSFM